VDTDDSMYTFLYLVLRQKYHLRSRGISWLLVSLWRDTP